jgi:hypothetical protein
MIQDAVITYKSFQYEVSFEHRRASRFFTIQTKTLLLQQSAAVRVSLCSAAVMQAIHSVQQVETA